MGQEMPWPLRLLLRASKDWRFVSWRKRSGAWVAGLKRQQHPADKSKTRRKMPGTRGRQWWTMAEKRGVTDEIELLMKDRSGERINYSHSRKEWGWILHDGRLVFLWHVHSSRFDTEITACLQRFLCQLEVTQVSESVLRYCRWPQEIVYDKLTSIFEFNNSFFFFVVLLYISIVCAHALFIEV